MTLKNRKVTIPVSIGYGLTDIMGGGAFTVIGAWLLFFYTTFVGLSPIEAASIVAIARIVDAIVSLFMGSFTDHFYKNYLGKKFGRRRFFLLIGAPLMLVYILLWMNGMNFWFYLAVYLAFEVIAAMVLIPWETLPSEMTKDFNDRTKLSTCRMFLSASGTFLATFIPGLLIGWLGENRCLFNQRGSLCRYVYPLRIHFLESHLGARVNAGNAGRNRERDAAYDLRRENHSLR